MAEDSQFKIGDRVILTNSANKDQEGTIRFLGSLDGKEGTWCGIELNIPKGTHSGEFEGKRYFECQENHGLFVREKHLQLVPVQAPTKPAEVEKPSNNASATSASTVTGEKKVKPPIPGSSTLIKPSVASVATTAKLATKAASSTTSSTSSSSMKASTSTTSSAATATTNKKDQELLLQRELEINQLKEELERKEDLLNYYAKTIEDSQSVMDSKELEVTELSEQIKKLESKVQQEKKVVNEKEKQYLDSQVKLEKALEDVDLLSEALKEAEEAALLVEELTIAKENAEHRVDEVKKELTAKIAENKQLHEEKRLAQIELEEAMDGAITEQNSSGDGSAASAELIKNNARLRQAVQVLNDQLELVNIESLEKIIELEGKIEKLPELEASIAQLLKQIEDQQISILRKNEEIDDLKESLELNADSVEMVERLTDQKQELEEKIMAQKIEIKELKEFKKVNDELILGYEETVADMQNENTTLEYQLYEQKRLVQEKEDQLHDSEKVIELLRQRAKSLKDQSESFKLEASSSENAQTSTAEKAVSNIQKLLEQQQELFAEKRVIYKRYVESSMTRINVGVESDGKQNVYLESIPDSIKGRIHADGFKQLITTQRNRKKAQLLLQELLFYLDRHASSLVQQENLAVFTWIDSLLNALNVFIYNQTRYEAQLISVKNEKELIELTKSGVFSSVVAGGLFVETVLKSLMDDNLSPKVALDPIYTANNKISDEAKAQTAAAAAAAIASLNDGNEGGSVSAVAATTTYGLAAGIQSRLDVEKSVEQVRLSMNSLIFTSRFYSNDKSNTRNADMLFGTLQKRIAEFLSYFNSVPVCSTQVHLNSIKIAKLQELSQALTQVIAAIPKQRGSVYLAPSKTELKDDMDEKQISAEEQEEKDKISHFRKLISETANLLSNLNSEIDQKVSQQQGTHENELFLITDRSTYWKSVVEKTRNELDGIGRIIENEKKLSEELTVSMKQVVQLQKSLDDLNKIKASLEQRVVQLQITSERVNGLENEKKRFAEKEKSFKEATDLIQKELDGSKRKYKDALDEIKNLKNSNPASSMTTSQAASSAGLTTSQVTRNSLPRFSMQPSLKMGTSTKPGDLPVMMQIMNQRSSVIPNQDDFQDLVKVYETENNILRSMQLKDRMKKLTQEPSNLKAMKLLKEKNPEGELAVLLKSVKQIDDVHQKGLSVLASKQIIDLNTLASRNLLQKDENITQHLLTNNKSIEALRFEAYNICNSLSKKVSGNATSFKQRFEMPTGGAGPASELHKMGSIILNNLDTAAASNPAAPATKLTVSMEDWKRIKEIF